MGAQKMNTSEAIDNRSEPTQIMLNADASRKVMELKHLVKLLVRIHEAKRLLKTFITYKRK